MSISSDFPEDWTLYGEISDLSNIEPGEFSDKSTSTLQHFLKCQTGNILNGSRTSDEVIAEIPVGIPEVTSGIVSPLQGLSPAGSPPTSPPQGTYNDPHELSDILGDVSENFSPSEWLGQQNDTFSSSSDDILADLELNQYEQVPDFRNSSFQISNEDLDLLRSCFELNGQCDKLDSPPPSPRYEPYNVNAKEKNIEKKLRKKQQNKDAASRYRLKKKAQKQEQGGELEVLMEKNKNLKSECKEKLREIDYLKELLRDVCKAKGLEPPVSVLK